MNLKRDLILVTGAAGWIGRRVCMNLRERGCRVAAFDLVGGVGPWDLFCAGELGDFREPSDALRRILKETTAVIHCAGRAHRPIETAEEIALFEETNVEGTRALVSASQAAGVQRLVYISTVAGYDWTMVPLGGHTEDAAQKPVTAYARTKLEGERLVRDSGMDWRTVRLATVFGDGDRANFAKLALALRCGKFVVPGKGLSRKSVIPVDLAAEALVQLVLLDSPKYRLLNVALAEAPSLREICDDLSTECGFRRAHLVPTELLRAGALFGDVLALWHPGFPLTTTNIRKLTTSTVVDASRLRETLPNLPSPAFREALKRAAPFYRAL